MLTTYFINKHKLNTSIPKAVIIGVILLNLIILNNVFLSDNKHIKIFKEFYKSKWNSPLGNLITSLYLLISLCLVIIVAFLK